MLPQWKAHLETLRVAAAFILAAIMNTVYYIGRVAARYYLVDGQTSTVTKASENLEWADGVILACILGCVCALHFTVYDLRQAILVYQHDVDQLFSQLKASVGHHGGTDGSSSSLTWNHFDLAKIETFVNQSRTVLSKYASVRVSSSKDGRASSKGSKKSGSGHSKSASRNTGPPDANSSSIRRGISPDSLPLATSLDSGGSSRSLIASNLVAAVGVPFKRTNKVHIADEVHREGEERGQMVAPDLEAGKGIEMAPPTAASARPLTVEPTGSLRDATPDASGSLRNATQDASFPQPPDGSVTAAGQGPGKPQAGLNSSGGSKLLLGAADSETTLSPSPSGSGKKLLPPLEDPGTRALSSSGGGKLL